MTNFKQKPSNFYDILKIHEDIQQVVTEQETEHVKLLHPKDLKLGTIIAGPTCPTHCLILFIILK